MSGQAGSPGDMFATIQELALFLTDHGIDHPLASDEDRWVEFVSLMVKVLENQPILKPTADVTEFRFEPTNVRCVLGVMEFAAPVKGKHFYRYGNAYC